MLGKKRGVKKETAVRWMMGVLLENLKDHIEDNHPEENLFMRSFKVDTELMDHHYHHHYAYC